MSMTTECMTPADIAAVTGNCNGNGNGGAWGGEWSSWIIIFLIFAMFGWGGNRGFGNGYGGGNGGGAADNYVLASDFATLQRMIGDGNNMLERKLDNVNNGLCDGFYTQAQLIAGVNQNIATNGYETRNAITQAQIAEMQNSNALQAQIAQCCCDTREAIAGVNYNMAMNTNTVTQAVNNGFCQTNFNNQNNTRDIIENQNGNTRAILDALTAQRIEAKDAKIAEQAANIQALNLAASQAAQNTYLVNQLRPCPSPAYVVPNPYCCNTGYNNCNC